VLAFRPEELSGLLELPEFLSAIRTIWGSDESFWFQLNPPAHGSDNETVVLLEELRAESTFHDCCELETLLPIN